MKVKAVSLAAIIIGSFGLVVVAPSVATATTHDKVAVCKYDSKPGEKEVLKAGKNPIDTSVNTLKGFTGTFPYPFVDAHLQSIAIGWSNTGLTIANCPGYVTPTKTVTATVTATATTTVTGPTVVTTTTVPGPTVTVTETAPAATVTVTQPQATVTETKTIETPGPTVTTTATATATATETTTERVAVPGPTVTVTQSASCAPTATTTVTVAPVNATPASLLATTGSNVPAWLTIASATLIVVGSVGVAIARRRKV